MRVIFRVVLESDVEGVLLRNSDAGHRGQVIRLGPGAGLGAARCLPLSLQRGTATIAISPK